MAPAGSGSRRIVSASAKAASTGPTLEMVSVQSNATPTGPLPPVSLDFETVSSGRLIRTVSLSWLEVTPSTVAEAVLVTEPAVTSPAVMV